MEGSVITQPRPQKTSNPDYRSPCGHLRTAQLKRLLNISRALNVFNGIILFQCLSFLCLLAYSDLPEEKALNIDPFALWLAIIYAAVFIMIIKRNTLGLVGGYMGCGLFLITFHPVFMLLAIFGIFSMIRSYPLFKPTPITHKDLKTEWKRRKRNKKKQKKRA